MTQHYPGLKSSNIGFGIGDAQWVMLLVDSYCRVNFLLTAEKFIIE